MSAEAANDVLFGGGTPAAQFKSPGDTFAGPITKLEAVQARKFGKDNKPTDELDTWPNGDPKMQAVVTLRTDHRDPSDPSDEGDRKVYIASRFMQAAVREAVKRAGKRSLDIGGILRVTFTHEERQAESGLNAKMYEVDYTPVSAAAANQALGVTSAQVAPNLGPQATTYAVTTPGTGTYVQPQVTIPTVQQTMAQPVPEPAAAPASASLESLPPEARALVERMLAQQRAGA